MVGGWASRILGVARRWAVARRVAPGKALHPPFVAAPPPRVPRSAIQKDPTIPRGFKPQRHSAAEPQPKRAHTKPRSHEGHERWRVGSLRSANQKDPTVLRGSLWAGLLLCDLCASAPLRLISARNCRIFQICTVMNTERQKLRPSTGKVLDRRLGKGHKASPNISSPTRTPPQPAPRGFSPARLPSPLESSRGRSSGPSPPKPKGAIRRRSPPRSRSRRKALMPSRSAFQPVQNLERFALDNLTRLGR